MRSIYIDMDGVVADFDGYVKKVTGHEHVPGTKYDSAVWKELSDSPIHQRLFSQLGFNRQFEKTVLVRIAYTFNFLTAIPHNDHNASWRYAPHDKLNWVKEKFWPSPIKVFFGPYAEDKQKYCRPGDILIDDNPKNIDQWRAAGGEGFLYRWGDDQACREWIDKLL